MLYHSAGRSAFTSLIPQLQPMAPALALWVEAVRRHQIRLSFGRMTDAQLRDIGLTPHEVEVALSLPFDRRAGDFLAWAAGHAVATPFGHKW